jgi:23S rRNA (cytidine1920-2'-O)/16S rRNA (cytidine1409-2'-O)-methyltransferase
VSSSRERLDILLVRRGLFPSREQAQRAIMAGDVETRGRRLDKASEKLLADTPLEIRERPRYVGRGGLKLEAALAAFDIRPDGWVCLDAGASTGGFTDCLLQHGAARVHAFDVGHGQLDWKLRNDPRVVVREKFNVRHLLPADVGEPVELFVADVSFISLTLVLPALCSALTGSGMGVVLIKPQFELGPHQVGKGGIVSDPALHEAAVDKIRRFSEQSLVSAGIRWAGVIPSPITGADGNREFLAWLRK